MDILPGTSWSPERTDDTRYGPAKVGARGDVSQLGLSAEGRPILIRRFGDRGHGPRILVVAGQHGDEPLATRAAHRLATRVETGTAGGARLELAVVECLNPDGAARSRRWGRSRVDLNRDHQLLTQPETRALHRFVREWRPHLVIDVHTYPPRRKHLLRQGLVYCHDVFLEGPTSLSLPGHALLTEGGRPFRELFVDRLITDLAAHGLRAGRYTLLTRGGRVRHSTPDVIDLRNGIALRYGLPTLLLEGRQPTRGDGPHAASRTERALAISLEGALGLAADRFADLARPVPRPWAGESVVIGSAYGSRREACRLEMADKVSGEVRVRELSGRNTPDLRATAQVGLPRGYAVPLKCGAVLEVLRRSGLSGRSARPGDGPASRYRILGLRPSRRARRAPREINVELVPAAFEEGEYRVFPTGAAAGPTLAVLLEPGSKYGLVRYPELGLLAGGSEYPVLRLA